MKMTKFPNEESVLNPKQNSLQDSDDEDIVELDLNDENIEESESIISGLIDASKNQKKYIQTSLDGYLNLHIKNMFNKIEIKKKYFKFNLEQSTLEYSDEKDSKILKKYILKPSGTLLFTGKQKDLYILKITQEDEIIFLSTEIVEQYYTWLRVFQECNFKKSNLEFENKSPRRSLHLENGKFENVDFILWKEKHVQEWLKTILFYHEEKDLLQVLEIFEKKKLLGMELNQKLNFKKLLETEEISETLMDIEDEINRNLTILKLDKSKEFFFHIRKHSTNRNTLLQKRFTSLGQRNSKAISNTTSH
jgi:hypothetical protein